jgi:hypothetical protein
MRRKPPVRGGLTVVTDAFSVLKRGADPKQVRAAAEELHSRAEEFAADGTLMNALESALSNSMDLSPLFRELGKISREKDDSRPVGIMMDAATELMKSNPLTGSSAAGLVKLLFTYADQTSRALALEECIGMLTRRGSQKPAAEVLSSTFQYLGDKERAFVTDSMQHIKRYGLRPDSSGEQPQESAQETAASLLERLVPPRILDLQFKDGSWQV